MLQKTSSPPHKPNCFIKILPFSYHSYHFISSNLIGLFKPKTIAISSFLYFLKKKLISVSCANDSYYYTQLYYSSSFKKKYYKRVRYYSKNWPNRHKMQFHLTFFPFLAFFLISENVAQMSPGICSLQSTRECSLAAESIQIFTGFKPTDEPTKRVTDKLITEFCGTIKVR